MHGAGEGGDQAVKHTGQKLKNMWLLFSKIFDRTRSEGDRAAGDAVTLAAFSLNRHIVLLSAREGS